MNSLLQTFRHARCLHVTQLAVVVLASTFGCSKGLPRGDVVGQVTLEGNPVNGTIRFLPADGNTPSAGAMIVNGRYEARRVPVNRCKVQISVPATPSQSPGGKDSNPLLAPAGKLPAELIPARYNSQTELIIDVQEGLNANDFDLKLN